MKRTRLLFLILLLVSGIVLSACSGGATAASSWPGLTVDAKTETAYLAYNQEVYAINLSTGADGAEIWHYPAKANNSITFFAPPALTDNGQLIVGGYNDVLYNLNAQNGQENQGTWPFQVQDVSRYIAGPLVTNQMIYAPNADAKLYALDLNGNLAWQFEKSKEALWATPAINGNTIYLSSMDHHVYALDAQTGNLVWESQDLGGAVPGTPAIGPDGVLYVGSFASELSALDPKDGKVLWKFPAPGWIWSGPLLDNGTLYFGDLNGNFYAVGTDGKQIWMIPAPQDTTNAGIAGTPLLLDGTIYYTTENGDLYAVDTNGKPLWNKNFGGKIYPGPKAAGNTLLITPVGADSTLIAVDTSGKQLWSFPPPKK